jgi:glutathionylspermidine synthase
MSEVNSDVPGGFGEADALPGLFQQFVSGVVAPISPLTVWGCTIESELKRGRVALLHAPGFLEDQQVVFALARELKARGFSPYFVQSPEALRWTYDGVASLAREPEVPICAVIRFFQAEWLARHHVKSGWQELFRTDGFTRISNPAHSVISESKRLPLSFPLLNSTFETWRELLPACIDPIALGNKVREDWVLKAAYANTGDAVHLGAEMSENAWTHLLRRAQKKPTEWIAQRRFETLTLESEQGPVHPCIGVFVIANKAAGAYVRLSRTQVTDAYALEAPLFIVPQES